jgi:hypothetical protein
LSLWFNWGQAVKTNGYICETLGSASAVTARYQDLSGKAVVAGSSLLQQLLAQAAEGGPISASCAKAAGMILGMALLAMSGNQSLVPADGQVLWMDTLEGSMGQVGGARARAGTRGVPAPSNRALQMP